MPTGLMLVTYPDELRSNRMNTTLDLLKHRVTATETGVAESLDGAVIAPLNEEAVVCATLANKGGINIVVTYEAFAVKMLGAMRQEIILARHRFEAGQGPGWLSVPVMLSSHTWENRKAAGMLFANRCTWAHAIVGVAEGLKRMPGELLNQEELNAVQGKADPRVIMNPQ